MATSVEHHMMADEYEYRVSLLSQIVRMLKIAIRLRRACRPLIIQKDLS